MMPPLLSRLRCPSSITGSNQLHVALDFRIGANPRVIADENSGASAVDQHPQAVHVSISHEQAKNDGDVIRARSTDVVVLLTDQVLAPVSNELAERIRNLDIPVFDINHRGVIGRHVQRKLRFRLLAKHVAPDYTTVVDNEHRYIQVSD